MSDNFEYDVGTCKDRSGHTAKTEGKRVATRKGMKQLQFRKKWVIKILYIQQGLNRFYESVVQAILRHVNFDIVKCIIIASPGFVKDQFMENMIQQATKTDNKVILENKVKFILVHASSGFKHSLKGIVCCTLASYIVDRNQQVLPLLGCFCFFSFYRGSNGSVSHIPNFGHESCW